MKPGRSITAALLFIALVYMLYKTLLAANAQGFLGSVQDYSEEDRARAHSHEDDDLQTPLFQPPLHTKGRYILDASGARFKLASINWYGASDELFIPGGLDLQHRDNISALIRRLGFNSVRLPYSDQMVRSNPVVAEQLLEANADLIGLRALDIYKAVVDSLTEAGIAVIINNHITRARWCCDGSPCDTMWWNSYLGPLCAESQTEDAWIEHWETVMRPHISNPFVVGADLRNEPRSLFGALGWAIWVTAAERLSARLLAMQSNWLIIFEGTSSANDLARMQTRPINLTVPNRLVCSAHVYGWSGWGSGNPYWTRPYPAFAGDMYKNWGYLLESNTVPVWIGEFGAPTQPNKGDMHYWKNLMRYMEAVDVDFAYWALNPRKPDGSREGYALLEDDWVTPRFDYRMYDIASLRK